MRQATRRSFRGDVPLSEMFGYVSELRSMMSQGRASYTMQFSHYEQVPDSVVTRSWRDSGSLDHRDRSGRFDEPALTERRRQRGTVDGQGEVRADEASRERGDDRSRGSRQDDADGCDHGQRQAYEGSGGLHGGLRRDRQGSGGARARDHDRDGARGVPDGSVTTRTWIARATRTT